MKEMHYTKVDVTKWRWKNFSPKEIACKGDGMILIDEHAMDCLQRFRDLVGGPVVLNSAYRSETYNKKVGGAPKSQHLLGRAFDVQITDRLHRDEIHKLAKSAGFSGFGDYNTFVHIDIGPARYWDLRK